MVPNPAQGKVGKNKTISQHDAGWYEQPIISQGNHQGCAAIAPPATNSIGQVREKTSQPKTPLAQIMNMLADTSAAKRVKQCPAWYSAEELPPRAPGE